jgi:hypothetical protein
MNTYYFLDCIFSVFFVLNIWFSLPIIPYYLKHFIVFCSTPNPIFFHSCVSHHVQIVLFLWQCLVQNFPAFLQEHVDDLLQNVLHLHFVFFPPMGRYLLYACSGVTAAFVPFPNNAMSIPIYFAVICC